MTYYRVTAANIDSVEINHDLTLRETRGAFTDFRRLAFTITTEAGDVVSVEADRCVSSLFWPWRGLPPRDALQGRGLTQR